MNITQAFDLEAAHSLPAVPSWHKCARVHGHSYRIELKLCGAVDPKTGFVIDFFDVEKKFQPLLNQLDHQYLNEVDGLDNPTAENIAIWIWRRLQPGVPFLSAVRVFETRNCWAEYEGT